LYHHFLNLLACPFQEEGDNADELAFFLFFGLGQLFPERQVGVGFGAWVLGSGSVTPAFCGIFGLPELVLQAGNMLHVWDNQRQDGNIPIDQAGDSAANRFKQGFDVVDKTVVGFAVSLVKLLPGLQSQLAFSKSAGFLVPGCVVFMHGSCQNITLGAVQKRGEPSGIRQAKG